MGQVFFIGREAAFWSIHDGKMPSYDVPIEKEKQVW
jgi:hypothetical protein